MMSEIEEEEEERLESIREDQFEGRSSGRVSMNGEDNIYVGVGKGESSMDALCWTLRHFISSSNNTLLFLLHVFPETHFIPYPCKCQSLHFACISIFILIIHEFSVGRLPRDQASQEQLDTFMSQERAKRRALLNQFLHVCSSSKVKVETILVESDSVAKAIQDLIPILNIRKLVLGISKSNSRKLRSRRGNSVAEQILGSAAADTCEVKVICEGVEMKMEETESLDGRQRGPSDAARKREQAVDPFACICFRNKPKTNN